MMDLPNPLTPADCNLRDFPFMPIEVKRLLTSETWVLGTGDERAAAITLWLESWHQIPAASLPADDRMLGHLSQAKSWKRVKDHALRGWVKCADGRLYHPVAAEKVLEAWLSKLTSSLSGSVGNAKRWGIEIDTDAVRAQVVEAARLLKGVAPQSEWLRKKQVKDIVADSRRDPDPIAPRSPDESPPDSPPDRKREGEGEGEVNDEHSGGGTAQAVTREDAPNAAAAFVEILRSCGVAFVVDDERVAGWPALGATPDDLRTAIGFALARRKREKSDQPLNVGLLNSILPDAIAARAGRTGAGARAAPAGPWWTSWPGIVAHGRSLDLEQGEHETCPDFKLRVFRAAGDGPWWDDHNRAFRNSAGPVAAGAMLGGTG
ncbi:YdaU family protein [Burkholderia glumae]|uniref:YdaU family protein n=1 Tax=Burkholderia glumae TaxID=337 RepID=UPI002164282D|nr:YdaU family protein [Burkholderia glumae]